MRKTIIIAFFSLVALSAITAFYIFSQTGSRQNKVCFKNSCFKVELALSQEEQAKGLMFKEKLGQDEGMLFIFKDEAGYSFWMKNTLIPLDIIWLDRDKKVIFISKNAQPCQADPCPLISPMEPTQYVLELNSGIADKIGLRIGDKMNF